MTRNEFIEKVAELAKADTRILPSLTIAQAILESGWGNSGLTIRANALFGIKAGKSWKGKVYSAKTQECYDGVNFVSETAVFRAYDSWAESVQDHTEFLCGLKRYAKVVGEKDYRKACEAIQAAGYATDPNYANKLVSLIVRHGLTKYDPAATDQEKTDTAATYKVKSGDTLGKIAEEHGTTVADIVAANKAKYPKITADYIQTGWELVISKNETTTHKVKRGDTLGEIAKEHGTTVADIVAANKAKYPKITADYIQTGWTLTV